MFTRALTFQIGFVKKKTGTMSSSSGYVTIPRCSVIFDGTNYTEFVAFMRIHILWHCLWGGLSGEVPCLPRPVPPVAPTPPTPPTLVADATQAAKDAAKAADDAAVHAYDQQILAYEEALPTYHEATCACTRWFGDDGHAAAVLISSVLLQFASEFMGLTTIFEMWSHLGHRYQPSGDALYLYVVH